MRVGIEAINFYAGRACLDIRSLFEARKLDLQRFDNLMVRRKTVALPCEDPVTFAVNAAKPLLDSLPDAEINRIELLICATESGLDFGKPIAAYLQDYLSLRRKCRIFEVKSACYAGTAALQMAAGLLASNVSPGAKALVIASDIGRPAIRGTYAEPTQGAGAVAMLLSTRPYVLELDWGANGFHGYEVMDTCRPTVNLETGDPDLSLMSYLECLQHSLAAYSSVVELDDFVETFDYLAFHTPFPGMVKGAHRMLMRKLKNMSPEDSERDFERRVRPSLAYCSEVGNIYSASLYLALCGVIDKASLDAPARIGMYSYGSGCCGEFFSGVITSVSRDRLGALRKEESLQDRYQLTTPEYDTLLEESMAWPFGTKDKEVDLARYQDIYDRCFAGRGLLVLERIANYHREYRWS
jgi:polyketide biosynthesis 3-hydroxy-3-methylglutaryl-CoA synthase-like enzyme PksG